MIFYTGIRSLVIIEGVVLLVFLLEGIKLAFPATQILLSHFLK